MQEESVKSINKLREMVEAGEETGERKFIRCKQGIQIYNMSRPQFIKLAVNAGAAYKINSMILVDKAVFDAYLETFKVPADAV